MMKHSALGYMQIGTSIVCFAVGCGKVEQKKESSAADTALTTQADASTELPIDERVFGRPIPVVIRENGRETRMLPSAFYLVAKEQRYDTEISKLNVDDPEEALLIRAVTAMKADNSDEFWQLTPAEERETSYKLHEIHCATLAKIDNPHVLHSFKLGNLTYFVIRSDDERVPFVPCLIVRGEDGQLRYSLGAIATPVAQIVTGVIAGMLKHPKEFQPQDVTSLQFDISLMPCFGSDDRNPASIFVHGWRMNYPIVTQTPVRNRPASTEPEYDGTAVEALSFYSQLWRYLKSDDFESFVNCFSEFQRPRLRKQLTDSSQLDAIKRSGLQSRYVSFVAASDKSYILVYQAFSGAYRESRPVFDHLVRNENGAFQLSNVSGGLYGLLSSKMFGERFVAQCVKQQSLESP